MTDSSETTAQPTPNRRPRSDSGDGRFLPGTVLAGRYRMIGLLGRGGMGEVYRADDLKLGQPVALKFLPLDVEHDPDRLGRFLTEVRMSLKVTHPNICRVYDIGQADGRHFLSMEYVDGEDLASLLRRIGRLPEDKAVEIARQLCAGLQAAHDEGVLHRDLKPANVMLDGRGRAKITDFGLAGATEGIAGLEARAGTPQYMAPEQTAGGALTTRTDIYSLGLVLYELFTGKRAFDAKTRDELVNLQRSTPTAPSSHVSGLDPVVERAILRCLDPDPAKRPASATDLSAALPGGDPLAMAIAAGQTPSPDIVARAGGVGAMRPLTATVSLVFILAGLAGVWIAESRSRLYHYTPITLSPSDLSRSARSTIAALGYPTPPVDTAEGFGYDLDQLLAVRKTDQSVDRWRKLADAVPAPVYFWYRESPVPLVPSNEVGRTGTFDPPMTQAGMAMVRLDPQGHVWMFRAVPPVRDAAGAAPAEPDWLKAFELAGLDPATFQPAEPRWTPPQSSDARRAWTRGDLRVEAAAFVGRLVWFEVIPTWKPVDAGVPPAPLFVLTGLAGVVWLIILFAAFLARRNYRAGRSDVRGAFRLAGLVLALSVIVDWLQSNSSVVAFVIISFNNLAIALFGATFVWVAYLAIEPYVRRLWPRALIAWTRMLEGRLRDPLVGRDLLIGAVGGIAMSAGSLLPHAATWFGAPTDIPAAGALIGMASTPGWLAGFVEIALGSLRLPVLYLLVILILRVVLRKPWLAYGAWLLFALLAGILVNGELLTRLSVVLMAAIALVVLTRFGLFAFVATIAFSSFNALPLTTDPGSWYFAKSVLTMLFFAAIAVYAFALTVGPGLTFKDPVLD